MTDGDDCPDAAVNRFTVTRRHLPHWQSPGAYHYLTFVLADRRICDLTRPHLARTVVGALLYFHGERYALDEHTVIPDHVHLVLQPLRSGDGWVPLRQITHSLKSWTANEINKKLGRRGPLWLDESYDRIIRDEEHYRNRAAYIWMNAFKEGLTDHPDRWPWFGNGQEEWDEGDGERHGLRHCRAGMPDLRLTAHGNDTKNGIVGQDGRPTVNGTAYGTDTAHGRVVRSPRSSPAARPGPRCP